MEEEDVVDRLLRILIVRDTALRFLDQNHGMRMAVRDRMVTVALEQCVRETIASAGRMKLLPVQLACEALQLLQEIGSGLAPRVHVEISRQHHRERSLCRAVDGRVDGMG